MSQKHDTQQCKTVFWSRSFPCYTRKQRLWFHFAKNLRIEKRVFDATFTDCMSFFFFLFVIWW